MFLKMKNEPYLDEPCATDYGVHYRLAAVLAWRSGVEWSPVGHLTTPRAHTVVNATHMSRKVALHKQIAPNNVLLPNPRRRLLTTTRDAARFSFMPGVTSDCTHPLIGLQPLKHEVLRCFSTKRNLKTLSSTLLESLQLTQVITFTLFSSSCYTHFLLVFLHFSREPTVVGIGREGTQ